MIAGYGSTPGLSVAQRQGCIKIEIAISGMAYDKTSLTSRSALKGTRTIFGDDCLIIIVVSASCVLAKERHVTTRFPSRNWPAARNFTLENVRCAREPFFSPSIFQVLKGFHRSALYRSPPPAERRRYLAYFRAAP